MSSNLTNADFQSLLNASDQSVLKGLTTRKKRKKPAAVAARGGGAGLIENALKRGARKDKYLQLQKNAKKASASSKAGGNAGGSGRKDDESPEKEEAAESLPKPSNYVDRAASRREMSAGHEQMAQEFSQQTGLSITESKYLGGDAKHTHLVKGLDFALLAKVREELNEEQRAEKNRIATPPTIPALLGVSSSSNRPTAEPQRLPVEAKLGQRVLMKLSEQLHPHHVTYAQKLKHMNRILLRGSHFKRNTQNFLPGRMRYEFSLSRSESDSDPAILPSAPLSVYCSFADSAHLMPRRVDHGLWGSGGSLVAYTRPALEVRLGELFRTAGRAKGAASVFEKKAQTS